MRLAVLRSAALSAIPAYGGCALPPSPQQTEATERPTQQLPELVLSEAWAFPLPYNQSLRGAFGPTTGSVPYWTASGAWIRQNSPDRWKRLCPTQLRGLLTVGEQSGSSRRHGRKRRACRSLARGLPSTTKPFDETTRGCGRDGQWNPHGSARSRPRGGARPDPSRVGRGPGCTTAGVCAPGGGFVGDRLALLGREARGCGGRVSSFACSVGVAGPSWSPPRRGSHHERASQSRSPRSPQPGTCARWFALDPVDLGGIVLQVLADGVTGVRVARLFDSTGTLHRSRPLRAPIGFFALSSEGRLIGIRRRGFTQELAEYDWSWRRR